MGYSLVAEAHTPYVPSSNPSPAPEPPLDDPAARESDALLELGDSIALLAAHIHAATYRLLVMIEEFDRRGGWKAGDFHSCAHWLSWRTGIDLGASREKVRAARALCHLPETRRAMERGELSFSKVRALTRVATKDNESALVDFARSHSTAAVERMVRSWKRNTRLDEAELEALRHASRGLSVFPDEEGMYVVKGRVDPEVGAVLLRAIDAATDALYRDEKRAERDGNRAEREETKPEQRRADALGLVAEWALGDGKDRERPRGERYQVLLHVEVETLSGEGEPGRSELEDGTRVSAETSRRLCCDAGVVRVEEDAEGAIRSVGRRTRTVPPSLRRALRVRDRGCRFPGCGRRYTEAHHVEHWADGGATTLDNLVLLCSRHHRAVHEGGYTIGFERGRRVRFFDRAGHLVPPCPPPPPLPADPVAALRRGNARATSARPNAFSARARWKRDRDVPDSVVFAALEALD